MTFEREIMETKTNSTLIPAYASMNEAVFYVLEDNEKNFSDMITRIGFKELAVYESTGSVLLYEDGSEEKKEADGAKAGFVAKAWSNIRALFEKAMKKLGELVNKVVGALSHTGVVAKVAAGAAAHATKKVSVDELKGVVDNLKDDFLKGLPAQFKYTKLGKFEPVIDSEFVKLSFNENPSEADEQKNYSSVDKIKNHLGVSEINSKSVTGAFRDGEEAITKESIKSNLNDIYKSVTDTKTSTAALKTYFKDAKSSYDKFAKASKKGGSDKDSIGGLKALVQATSVVYGAIISEYYSIIFRNARIVLELNKLAKKSKKADTAAKSDDNGKTGESVEAETVNKDGTTEKVEAKTTDKEAGKESHNESATEVDSEIASLFDWSF